MRASEYSPDGSKKGFGRKCDLKVERRLVRVALTVSPESLSFFVGPKTFLRRAPANPESRLIFSPLLYSSRKRLLI